MEKKILLIDDDNSFREVMQYNLEEAGYTVIAAENGQEGLLKFQQQHPLVIITDLKMPEMDGMELLNKIHTDFPDVLVIVITAFGDVETAVDAMKKGAFDFIPKPFERDHFKYVVKKAWDRVELQNEVTTLRKNLAGFDKKLIYESNKMKEVDRLVSKVASSNATVLILGESGTGKEIVARELHKRSDRKQRPFVAVNCAAIPRDLMESELFGHKKGSFTGAVENKKGKFEQAHTGTIFLDEIGELPIELQPRLLRVLQEKVVNPVGGEQGIPVNVRVIAATNRYLKNLVEQKEFREDLYFRLNVFPIEIPPLRDRSDDILTLARHFVALYAKGKNITLSKELEKELVSQVWKGNVRELENACQRMVLLAESDVLTPELLPNNSLKAESTLINPDNITLPEGKMPLIELEKQIIIKALEKHDYNQSKTAAYLEIPRHVLLYRIEKYNIEMEK